MAYPPGYVWLRLQQNVKQSQRGAPLMQMRRFSSWCLLVSLAAMAGGAVAESEQAKESVSISQWLDNISRASLQHNYQGTFIYRCSAQMTALKIIHMTNGESGREKLISLNGPPQEVYQTGGVLSSSLLRNKQSLDGDPVAAELSSHDATVDAHALDQNYTLNLKGADRIAGRTTEWVEIVPKDKFRYGFQLWLDKETGLVLRSDMIELDGHLVEQVMFTDIELLSDQEAGKRYGQESSNTPPPEERGGPELVVNEVSKWRVANLPAGFHLTEHYYRRHAVDQPTHEQLVFTDGLASVSVFIEQLVDNTEAFMGNSRMGAVNAYGNVINKHQITVVGDVPLATVELIGQSVAPR